MIHIKLKTIDLFAGIGGVRLGFEQAFEESCETIFVSEFDKFAAKTYSANFNDDFEISGDITEIDAADVPDFDICLAGFPCQAFSAAGNKQGFSDNFKGRAKGTLFFDVVRICTERENKPKVIFCENVERLLTHDKGRTFEIIKGTLEECGYTVWHQVLNSKDFGVPQQRRRVYIVAFRNDIAPKEFSFPIGDCAPVCVRDILEDAPIDAKYYISDTYMANMEKHKAHHASLGHHFGYEILDLDGVSNTLMCGGQGKEKNLIIDDRPHGTELPARFNGKINDKDVRHMTPREWARLQGFPDDFKFVVSNTQLYKQFGNSVTVPVIKAIAEKIKEALV